MCIIQQRIFNKINVNQDIKILKNLNLRRNISFNFILINLKFNKPANLYINNLI